MVAIPRLPRLTLPIAPLGACAALILAAAAVLLAPDALLERAVTASGLPDLLAAAAPPLGTSARLLLALAAGLVAGAGGWAVLFLVVGARRIVLAPRPPRIADEEDAVPALRRADAHPDAPARRPIFAEQDLGAPFLAIRAADAAPSRAAPSADAEERGLPGDLDVPLAAFDPASVPDEPREPVRVVPSLARPAPLAPGERIATFAPDPATPAEPASLDALLRRLEESARQRPAQRPVPVPNPGGSLEDTLSSLRRLARQS